MTQWLRVVNDVPVYQGLVPLNLAPLDLTPSSCYYC